MLLSVFRRATNSHVVVGAFWYLLEKVTRLVGAFLIGAWVARYLGPESYGSLAYVLAIVALLGFLGSWGVESLVVRDLAKGELPGLAVISTYFFVRLGGALVVPLLGVGYVLLTHVSDPQLLVLVAICSSTVIFAAFDVADCWLQARQMARVTSLIRLCGFLCSAVFKVFLILKGVGVIWFAWAAVLEAALIATLYAAFMSRMGVFPHVSQCTKGEVSRLFHDGKTMALSALAVVVYSKIDLLVVGSLFSHEVLGAYAIAASMCGAWNMVGVSLVQAWAPRVSVAMTRGREAYIEALRGLIFYGLCAIVMGCAAITLLIGSVFDVLLGDEYAAGIAVVKILIWSSVFVFLGVATSQIIVNEQVYWVSLLRTFVGVGVSLLAIVPVASFWGVKGVAVLVGLSAALATFSIFFSFKVRKTLSEVFFPAGSKAQ